MVFTTVPVDIDNYLVKVKTPSQNSGKVKKGQKVYLQLDNYPNAEFGVINGLVDKISLMADEEGYYLVDIKLPNRLVTSHNVEIDFKQEMRATANIITEDLVFFQRIIRKLNDTFTRKYEKDKNDKQA